MKFEKQIKRLERKFSKSYSKLKRYEGKGYYRDLYLKQVKKCNELKSEIYNLIAPILEENNEAFKIIAQKNYELLENSRLNCKTHKTGWSAYGSFTTQLRGKIENNGLFYCKTRTTNLPFRPLMNFEYPSKFEGYIDCLGTVRLITVETEKAAFKTLPNKFSGTIDNKGRVVMSTEERETDILSGGRMIISEIIGNPFGNSQEKKEQFLTNKKELILLIEAYRKNFKS